MRTAGQNLSLAIRPVAHYRILCGFRSGAAALHHKCWLPMPCQHASGPIQWSIIVPSHNAAGRILAYLQNITCYMQNRGKPYKILVVDDGSTDATASIVKTMATTVSEIQLLRAPLRRDKGAAVRRGMQSAIGRLQLFTYADGATPVQELARLEQAVANGADVAIGSRSLASRLPDYAVHARWYRTIVSNLFNSLIQQKGLGGITDTQCGFKFFHHTVAADLFGVSSIDGYGFDLELLLCGATTRIPHRRNSGELVPSTSLKISHPQRRARHAAGISRDPTE